MRRWDGEQEKGLHWQAPELTDLSAPPGAYRFTKHSMRVPIGNVRSRERTLGQVSETTSNVVHTAYLSVPRLVRGRPVDARHFPTHHPNVNAQLSPMVDLVAEHEPEKLGFVVVA